MNVIEEKALVNDVDGEFIFLERDGFSCDGCSSSAGCGKKSLDSIFTFKSNSKLKLKNTLGLRKGDAVIISIPSFSVLLSAVLVYLIPIISLFIFSLLAKLFWGEGYSILFGLIGMGTSVVLVSKLIEKSTISEQLQPKLIRKVISINLE